MAPQEGWSARVSDALPPSVRTQLDDPFAELTGPLAAARRLSFEVVSSEPISPSVQRIMLTAPELAGFRYEPGQDVMLLVAADGNRPVRRRYTIRSLDRATLTLTLNIVLHGDGPGERWVRAARPGDTIEGIGPRGKITTSPEADWHLFMGDESAMPAILAMTESLPGDADATLVIEVPGPDDEQELLAPARTRLSWLHRLGGQAGDPALLAAEAAEIELPAGAGHAYLFGEASVVLKLREILAARGLGAGPDLAEGVLGARPRQRRARRAAQGRLALTRASERGAPAPAIWLTERVSCRGDRRSAFHALFAARCFILVRTVHAQRGGRDEVASAMAAEMSAVLSSTSAQTLTLGIDQAGRILQHDRGAGDILADKPGKLLGTDLRTLITGPGDPAEALGGLIDAIRVGPRDHHRADRPHGEPVGSRRRRDRRADPLEQP